MQERKRLLNFIDKYRQGWRHDGRDGADAWRPGDWAFRGWRPPYKLEPAPVTAPKADAQRGYFSPADRGEG